MPEMIQNPELFRLMEHHQRAVEAVQVARNSVFENASPSVRSTEAFENVARAERLLVQDGYELACALLGLERAAHAAVRAPAPSSARSISALEAPAPVPPIVLDLDEILNDLAASRHEDAVRDEERMSTSVPGDTRGRDPSST